MEEQVKTGGMNPMMIVGVIVIIAVAIGGFIFMQNNNNTGAETTEAPVEEMQPVAEAENGNNGMMGDAADEEMMDAMEEDVLQIEIEAGSFYYEPSVIRVQEGQTVRIVMTSVDMMHDFNIDELGVSLPITQSGDTATVEFVADQAGEFEYYCSVGNHRAQGQIGTLIVE